MSKLDGIPPSCARAASCANVTASIKRQATYVGLMAQFVHLAAKRSFSSN